MGVGGASGVRRECSKASGTELVGAVDFAAILSATIVIDRVFGRVLLQPSADREYVAATDLLGRTTIKEPQTFGTDPG